MNKFRHATDILGVLVHALTYAQTLEHIEQYIQKKKKGYICVSAVHLIMECQDNTSLQKGVNKATLATPDGMPLVWMLRRRGLSTERVYGPDLMLMTCRESARKGWNIFLLGGATGQSEILRTKLLEKFPSLHITGSIDTPHLPLSKDENTRINHTINQSAANIVFVGMGCPLQELWMIQNRTRLRSNMLIGVGAAFDFISGYKKQAPAWMRGLGLEWLFRLLQEPTRLSKRYLIYNLRFVLSLLKTCTIIL